MKTIVDDIIAKALVRYPALCGCEAQITMAAQAMISCYTHKAKILTCGNGGSAADAEHIVGELVKSFCLSRPLQEKALSALAPYEKLLDMKIGEKLQCALPAISLCGQTALSTAFLNDVDPYLIFAQQTLAYCQENDVFIGISTSGNSKNVLAGGAVAKACGAYTIGLTGSEQCKMDELFSCVIHVPATETYEVQELHLPVYHTLCLAVEAYFFA